MTDELKRKSPTAKKKATPKTKKEKLPKAPAKTLPIEDVEIDPAPELLPEPELEMEGELEAEVPAESMLAGETELEGELEDELEDEAEGEIEGELEGVLEDDAEPDFIPKPRPPAKLERLQKILAQAGVASRRKAEEMIEQGRVQVNGKIVTELGTKADAGRDHIRVDGKLLQGAERLRYYMLNKPRGFVTTVKDPEGRPTVMQFFEKMRERLYPVGRLDYMSEGLLLVTNDGELANRLTRAAAGVEKTYLVKVAGQPSEAELDILRGGVAIERGKPGSTRVRTAPARIRQVRQGDNPWYEVVLIEGRNRELRKMFEEVGHFVEKIRRVGYGPLVLDQEPGNLRELQPAELELLRKAADGTLRTPKSKELRRRNAMDAAGLPTVQPRPTIHPRPAKPFEPRPSAVKPGEFSPRKFAGSERPSRPARPFGTDSRSPGKDFRPAAGRPSAPGTDRGPSRAGARPPAKDFQRGDFQRRPSAGPARFGSERDTRPARPFGNDSRPTFKKDDRPVRPSTPFGAESTGDSRPRAGGSAGSGRTNTGRSFGAKPAWNKPAGRGDRPEFKRPAGPRRDAPEHDDDLGPVRPPNLHIEEIQQSDRPANSRPSSSRPYAGRSGSGSGPGRPSSPRQSSDRPFSDRPSSSGRPFRSEGGLPRAFTTSSGKPRPGGARPSSKPGKPVGRSYGAGSAPRPGAGGGSIEPRTGSGYRPAPGGKRSFDGPRPSSGAGPARPFKPRTEGASGSSFPNTKKFGGSSSTRGSGPRSESPRGERSTGTGWKPKTRYGGTGKPASAGGSKPRTGGFSKSGFKSKPGGSGPKRTGSRPGGKKRG
jgi:23S rRNA pseudouridine2605 synthase